MGDAGPIDTNLTLDAERAALTSRVIPRMTLSTVSNPLTAPLPPSTKILARERAAERFAVTGTAVVTGGAGGLGYVSCRALLEHGVSGLTILDLPSTIAGSHKMIDLLRQSFPDTPIFTIGIDVRSDTAVKEAFEEAYLKMGSIDVLCCFAGIVGCIPSTSSSSEHFNKIIEVNLTGSFLCAQAAARYMIESRRGGSIIFTTSISAQSVNFPQPQAAYNASKAGVAHMMRSLAAEWAVHGIRVNAVAPGYMDTILNHGDGVAPLKEIWATRNPMGRVGDAEELTGAVVLLASSRAGRYMNGAELVVDGGALCF